MRQVHLDFHTSEYIDGIGDQFDKNQFQEALKLGHIESVTIFGKCHHGYCYYPSKVGKVHPKLKPGRDLTGEMMQACHEIGIRAPLYLTFGWSALDALEHPEWIAREADGSYMTCDYDVRAQRSDEKPECSWINLCSAGGYRDYLFELTREVCDRYVQLDGLFYDIVFTYDVCYCDHCVNGMRKMGLDPSVRADAKTYYQVQKKITLEGIRRIIQEKHPDASVFFNSVGVGTNYPLWYQLCTHYEVENLPTISGGYDQMPMQSRYFRGLGKEYLGMTGKFHKAWGEFGGFKTPEALKYECAAMMANGAGISIGDQLHPLGKMDMETYRNIGNAYAYVEQIEEYCLDIKETSKLGVVLDSDQNVNDSVAKLLLDCQIDFDIVLNETDLFRFDTIILPDNHRINKSMADALEVFIAQNGKILMLGGSGLREDSDIFAFFVPFTYKGKSHYKNDYFEIAEDKIEDMISSPILCYTSGHIIEGSGKTLSFIRNPYFNRTYEKYCSHANAPYIESRAEYPGAIKDGNIVYVAHELSKMYSEHGMSYHRRYFEWLLRKLYRADYVKVKMPSGGRVHLLKREICNQYVLHLLYGVPVQRGDVSVLEDFPLLRNTSVYLKIPETIEGVKLVPQNVEISFRPDTEGYVIVVPEIIGHQVIVITYVSE